MREDDVTQISEAEVQDQEPQSTEVTVLGEGVTALEFNTDEEMKCAIEKIERRNTYIDQVTKMALGKLSPVDFHDFGGKPFLQGVGAQRLIKYFGISIVNKKRIPERGYEIIEGDTANRLRVTYRATFSLGSMAIEGEGMRDTHNLLFGKKDDKFKEIADIELPNLDRAATTAMYRDGVSTLLGLKSLTWEYLKELGFSPDKTTGHTYKIGSKGGDMAGGDKETHKLKNEIGGMLLEMAEGDVDKAADLLEEYTEWTDKDGKKNKGKRKLEQLTVKQTPVIRGKVGDAYKEWLKTQGISGTEPPEQAELDLGKTAAGEDIPF